MNRPVRRDLFPGALEMMVLQTLRRGPRHAYGLAQYLKTTSDEFLQIEEGSLYPALQRMLKAGWISAEWGLSPRGRKVRFFGLTAEGAHRLEREVSAFERMLEGIARVMRPART